MRLLDTSALILAGGLSERMGFDKRSAVIGAKTLMERALERTRGRFAETLLCVERDFDEESAGWKGTGPGVRVVRDEKPGSGPLMGLACGLKASRSIDNFVMAVDMPFAAEAIIVFLSRFRRDFDVVIARDTGGLEPLLGFYKKSCLTHIEKSLSRGEERIVSFFGGVRVKVVQPRDWLVLDKDGLSFFNVNEAEDIARAERLMGLIDRG